MQEVRIVDTTLRDGEQTAGVVFTSKEKTEIAKLLDRIGIHQIEAGIPAMGGDEAVAIKRIIALGLKAKVTTWNRANINDIKKSIACGSKDIHISIPVSDLHIQDKLRKSRTWVIEQLARTVSYAQEQGCWVSVGAEDSSRADFSFLLEVIKTAEEYGASQFRYADTVGKLDPFQTYNHIKALAAATPLEIEFHAHNDFGLATANSLAALKAGATLIDTTVNGLGERAGNASFQEIEQALRNLYHVETKINPRRMEKLIQCVTKAANRVIPSNKVEFPIGNFWPVKVYVAGEFKL
jgi:homocitrate synthase NifV